MDSRCRIELFGGLRVVQGAQIHTRFRTQKAASLLAYLALNLQQAHSRELLIELFWSDKDTATGRDNLSTALAQLRRQLEPAGVPARSVIQGDWQQVRLNPEAVRTDAGDFDNLTRQARRCADTKEKAELFQQAMDLYCGELLPGNYADWAEAARNRYQNEYYESLVQLTALQEAAGQYTEALVCAERAVTLIPYDDAVRELRDRLLARSGGSHLIAPEKPPEKRPHPTKPGKLPAAERLLLVQKQRVEANRDAAVAAITPPLLPLQLTRFYGREREQEELARLLASPDIRLVTLLGPGGVGKSRLSLEVASRTASHFDGRVWFVPLAEAAQPEQVTDVLLRTLRLPPDPPGTALERIVLSLDAAPALLVLDNLEQLVHDEYSATTEATLGVIRTLLQRAPGLVCLTTSRVALGLGGEQVIPVDPFPVPVIGSRPESLLQNESVALYVDRARAVRADFTITDQNGEAVAAVCRLLEGVPLAIEMAAGWVRTLSPQKMQERLEQKMDLLVSRRRDLPARHQSLYATIEWSYDLLAPELRKMFADLSVFRQSWSLEAAEAVCNGDTLEALRILQEHSLIVCVNDEEPRYRMLEPLREFAQNKRTETEGSDDLLRRHALYFAHLLQKNGKHGREWYDLLETEQDNLRSAFDWLLHDPESAAECLDFAGRLQPFWQVRGYFSEGRERLQAALTRPGADASTAERARATSSAATLAMRQMDFATAEKYHQESLRLWRILGNARGEASTQVGLGAVFLMQRDLDRAYEHYSVARTLYQSLGDDIGLSDVLNDIGNIERHREDFAASERYLRESLALRRRSGDSSSVANVLTNLAPILLLQGNLDGANECLTECLTLCRAIGNRRDGIYALRGFAELASAKEQWDRAILLFGTEQGLRQVLVAPRSPAGEQEHQARLTRLRARVGEAAFERLWERGTSLSWEESVAYALDEPGA